MSQTKTLTLNDGRQIPLLAFGSGTAHIRSKQAKDGVEVDRDIIDAVKTAIREGYRHLDNAEMYGTEVEVGVAIRESIDERVITSRKELWISSKISEDPVNGVEKAIDQTLEKLGPAADGYLDLFLIHTPYFAKSDEELQKAWAGMERVQASGKALSIGVSNYEASHLQATLATAKIPPAINQIEFHPYMTQRNGADLLEGLRERSDIAVSAYGAMSPLTRHIDGPLDEVLARLAEKYGVSTGVVCMRWCLDQDVVVITTSQKLSRMKEYWQAFDFALTPEEVAEVTKSGMACLEGQGELKPRIVKYYETLAAKK